ncbi:MAG: right-handed parallel beta-helix repeat-containing protein [Lachnospiraceae bacterium]|nr:right-handed parallel beta-helix repeat-containing protein [Lachnospiraceae bacterium]
MKKAFRRLAVVMSAVLALSFVLFGSMTSIKAQAAEKARATYEDAGFYEMTYISADDEELTTDDLEEYGIIAGLVLNEDGTGFLYLADDITEFTWQDGQITADGEVIEYNYRRDTITLEEDDEESHIIMKFTLSDEEAPTIDDILAYYEDMYGEGYDDGGEDDGGEDDFSDWSDFGYTDSSYVRVDNVEDFINAIQDNATIVLEPGVYNISEYLEDADLDAFDWDAYDNDEDYASESYGLLVDEVFDGEQLIVFNIDNLTIMSADKNDPAEIVVDPRYANVFTFCDCDTLELDHVVLGHSDGDGSCTGNVIGIDYSWYVTLNGCELYGCGAYAFDIEDSMYININDCDLHDCTYGVATIADTYETYFKYCDIHDCEEFTMFELSWSEVNFYASSFEALDGELITLDDYSAAKFLACTFDDDAQDSIDDAVDAYEGLITVD